MRITYLILLYLWLNCFVNVSANVEITRELLEEDIFLRQRYKDMDTALKRFTVKSLKFLRPYLLEANQAMNLSQPCLADFLSIGLGVLNMKQWAIQFLDATGKINAGVSYANVHMLGNYDQCLSATSRKVNGVTDFRGRYCLINFRPFLPDQRKMPNPYYRLQRTFANTKNLSELLRYGLMKADEGTKFPFFYGACVPSGCSVRDVEDMVNYVGDILYMNLTVEYCQSKDEIFYLSNTKLVIICILVLFMLLGIISSIMEYHSDLKNIKHKGVAYEVLQCFSITKNFPKLINTKGNADPLSCLHGIRVLTAFFVILSHKFLSLVLLMPLSSNFLPNFYDQIPTFFYQIALNGFLSPDIFLFLSGFLNIYTRMKMAEKGKKFSWWMIMIHRLWRIYPSYIFTILLAYLLTPRGPIGTYFAEHFIENCSGHWWKNLLFINNFLINGQCLGHTWYIACDTQLFILSLVTVPILIRNPKMGILVNGAGIVLGLLTTSLWISMKKLAPAVLVNVYSPSGKEDMMPPYMSFSSHASTYFLAILMGYYMSRKESIKIPKAYQFIGWILASFTFVTMLFMTYRWHSGIQYTTLESAFYFTFSKPLYAASVGWMMFCCITGHGGIINYILSLKVWIPLSRLTFTIYLVSFPIQLFYIGNLKVPKDSYRMPWIWEYFGDLCVSCLLALVVGVLIEKPIFSLENIIFRGKDSKEKNESGRMATSNNPIKEENEIGYDVQLKVQNKLMCNTQTAIEK